MELLRTRQELKEYLRQRSGNIERSALVPTMGYLHEGHLQLIRQARQYAEQVALSIFVNPLQFNNPEDFARYPHDLQRDLQLARETGADLVFAPTVEEMYPDPAPVLQLSMSPLDQTMEGRYRPGHFPGVMLVVARLLHLLNPDFAFFGKKDYQQFRIVERMVRDLEMSVEVIGCETVRDAAGLALSSRNARLSERGLEHARLIYRALKIGEKSWREGIRDAADLTEIVRDVIESGVQNKVEYVSLADCGDLSELALAPEHGPFLIATAVYCEGVRLIDNLEAGAES